MGQTPNKPKLGQEYGGLAVVVVLTCSVVELVWPLTDETAINTTTNCLTEMYNYTKFRLGF